MGAAVLGPAPHQAAYAAETVRAGVRPVAAGQLAAAARGLPRLRRLRRTVPSQAMRALLPNAAHEVVSLSKGTPVLSVRATGELFYRVRVVHGRHGQVVPLPRATTARYVLLTTGLSVLQHHVERHYAKGAAR